jgi:hypothetical protein
VRDEGNASASSHSSAFLEQEDAVRGRSDVLADKQATSQQSAGNSRSVTPAGQVNTHVANSSAVRQSAAPDAGPFAQQPASITDDQSGLGMMTPTKLRIGAYTHKPSAQDMLVNVSEHTFVCVDCETTGVDASVHRVIEVAAVKFTIAAGAIDTFHTLVDPGAESMRVYTFVCACAFRDPDT